MIRYLIICLTLFSSLFCWAISSHAHEVRPAFLKISETEAGKFTANWKQPILPGRRLKIDPVFPESCNAVESGRDFGSGTLTQNYELNCDLKTGIIGVDGLERTLTDAFVEINYLSGETRRELLKPDKISFELSSESKATTMEYLRIGVEHILFGWDHLLFVLGLVLLVERRQIIGVATSFTIAHSITLALAAFGLLNLPTRPIEILIAMSIVLLAVEIMRIHQGNFGLSARRPYLIGFLIGLIHGCGFASALADIGLPKGTELLALLLFNIGVELGQFFIIALFVLFLTLLIKPIFNRNKFAEITMTYAIGSIAMYWVIDRLKDYIV